MNNNNSKFDYRLGTISQALNWKTEDGKILSYEPYIREMRIWADLFRHVDIFAPLSTDEIRITVSEYGFSNVDFKFVPYNYKIAWWAPFVRLLQLPNVLIRLTIFIWKHEVLLIRSPSHFGLFAHIIAFILRKRTITKYAGNFAWFEGERMTSIVERNFIRRILKPPHYVLVYGPSEASHLISFIPAAISKSEISELRALKKTQIDSSGKLIFYSLGKLIPVKNYDLAIHGLGLLYQEHPELDWEYHLIGDGIEYDKLLQLGKDYKIADRVYFDGKLSYTESMRRLVNADIVIMPGVKEGWPKVVIEGWAVGATPLVAAAGILPFVIKDGVNGYIFNPEPIDLKNKLVAIFARLEMLPSMKQTGYKEVEKFSIEEFSKGISEICVNRLQLK